MCVTHGLTSVNPKKHLIGHHLDWARGFPFEAFGLPDQYARVAPERGPLRLRVRRDFLKVLGEPWPGVREAERALAAEATAPRASTVADVRRERQALFDRWLAEQTRDQEAAARRRRGGADARRTPSKARALRLPLQTEDERHGREQGPPLEGGGGGLGADRGPGQVGHPPRWGSTWARARSWRRGARARRSRPRPSSTRSSRSPTRPSPRGRSSSRTTSPTTATATSSSSTAPPPSASPTCSTPRAAGRWRTAC